MTTNPTPGAWSDATPIIDPLSSKPTRPVLRYHGGKWMLAPWIISHFPEHRIYVEPYGGAASVLLRKPRSYGEVYNDLDGETVSLFRVLRERGPELLDLLKLTPFSRDEYRLSFEVDADPLEQARRTLVRSFMGFASNSLCRQVKSGFRGNANRSGTTPAHDWHHLPDSIARNIERLRGVCFENRNACDVMMCHDTPATLHYCDPPYVHSTRTNYGRHGARAGYAHEMSDDDHAQFIATIRKLAGKVCVSGYASDLYNHLLADWRRVERAALADGARNRTEVLWRNY